MGAGCSKQIYYFTFLKSTGKKKIPEEMLYGLLLSQKHQWALLPSIYSLYLTSKHPKCIWIETLNNTKSKHKDIYHEYPSPPSPLWSLK